VANSRFIARRIRKVYRREAEVVYPPVDIDGFAFRDAKEDFYLTASRFVPYKRVDLIVEAFAGLPDKRLVVIGDGPDAAKIRAKAGPNVTFAGYLPAAQLRDYMGRARAFVFAAEEDFGIVPVEAQACGTPVLAFGRGGALETVRADAGRDDRTGVFFQEQSAQAIREAVRAFEALQPGISPQACRANAVRFSAQRFRDEFEALVRSQWDAFRATL
jgi:glycosyltransferase involved in cell wall biosynthesis